MLGFFTNRDDQQIDMTVDGVPNGGSAYGGGAKANRFIDILDLDTVEVSQSTADTTSRSNEALGSTLNYLTSDPLEQQRVRLALVVSNLTDKRYLSGVDGSGSAFIGSPRTVELTLTMDL